MNTQFLPADNVAILQKGNYVEVIYLKDLNAYTSINPGVSVIFQGIYQSAVPLLGVMQQSQPQNAKPVFNNPNVVEDVKTSINQMRTGITSSAGVQLKVKVEEKEIIPGIPNWILLAVGAALFL